MRALYNCVMREEDYFFQWIIIKMKLLKMCSQLPRDHLFCLSCQIKEQKKGAFISDERKGHKVYHCTTARHHFISVLAPSKPLALLRTQAHSSARLSALPAADGSEVHLLQQSLDEAVSEACLGGERKGSLMSTSSYRSLHILQNLLQENGQKEETTTGSCLCRN